MSNQERAAEIAYEAMLEAPRKRGMEKDVPNYIAKRLADAGLLMPDLPAPKWPGFWEVGEMGIHLVDKDGEVNLDWREGDYYDSEDRSLWLSRDQVLAILAAAKLAEEQE